MLGPLTGSAWAAWTLAPFMLCAQSDTIALAANDTLPERVATSYLCGALGTSYAASRNWNGTDLRYQAFTGNVLYRHTLTQGGRSHVHNVAADLGYLKYQDSTWVKHLDQLKVGLLWMANGKRIQRSWSLALQTQFLPTEALVPDGDEGNVQARTVGGLLDPFALDAGYGAAWSFWGKSTLNFAFASFRLAGSPIATTSSDLAKTRIGEDGKTYYFLSYGLTLAALIDRSFGEHLQWLNNTRFFGNGLDKQHLSLQCSNLVVVKFWKYAQLRLDTRVAYDPLLNEDLQFRQEVLVGFFYERAR